jgi:hypothetical protein
MLMVAGAVLFRAKRAAQAAAAGSLLVCILRFMGVPDWLEVELNRRFLFGISLPARRRR